MGNGVLPDAKGVARCKIAKEHLLIQMPGEAFKRTVISKESLLYVAYSLNRQYVQLPGIHDNPVRVVDLPNDMLRSKVLMYKIETYKTFTAIIAGAGFTIWGVTGKKK